MLVSPEPVCVSGLWGLTEGGIGSWKGSGGHPGTSPASEHVVWAPVLMPPFSVQMALSKAHNLSSFLIYSECCYSSHDYFHNNRLMGYFISGIRMKWHIHIEAWNCFLLCVVVLFEGDSKHMCQRFIFWSTTPSITCPNNWNFCMRSPFLFSKSFLFLFLFWLHPTACGILDPLTRDRTRAPTGKVPTRNN